MALALVGVGSSANDGSGDAARTAFQKINTALEALEDLVGATDAADGHLGTFTGGTIDDDQTVKAALQALETAIEDLEAVVAGMSGVVGVDATADPVTYDVTSDYEGTATQLRIVKTDAVANDVTVTGGENSDVTLSNQGDTCFATKVGSEWFLA